MKLFAAAALMTFTSSISIALTQLPTPPRNHIDCGSLSAAQAEKIENETPAVGLNDLAKTCGEQAATFLTIAQEAQTTLPQKDITALYEKAANAHLYVASFTNTALFK